MSFWEQIKTGIILLQVMLLVFVFISHYLGTLANVFLATLWAFIIFYVAKALFTLKHLAEMYHVMKDVVPELIFQYYGAVSPEGATFQKFKGLFLINYPKNNLTVAWDEKAGIVTHDSKNIEQLKKVLVPDKQETVVIQATAGTMTTSTPQQNSVQQGGSQ